MAKVITIFGVTGNQGGSVASAILSDQQYRVRAAVRDLSSPTAVKLKESGAELVKADYNNRDSLLAALRGAYGCFFVTNTDFTNPDCLNQEILEGKNVADACVTEGITHIVYSTQFSAREIVGTEARHMDAKAALDTYMQNLGVPMTGVVVPFYYENLFGLFQPVKVGEREWRLRIPAIGEAIFDIMSVSDLGPIVKTVLNRPRDFIGKTIHPAGDKKNVREIAEILSKCLHPKLIKDGQMTYAEFKSLRFPGAVDIANQFQFISKHYQRGDLEFTSSIHPGIQSFEQWVAANKVKLHKICP